MKIENRTRTITQNYSVYVAKDGTEFETKKECEKYEKFNVDMNIEGIKWFDENFIELPLKVYLWEKVKYIQFDCTEKDIALNEFLEDFFDDDLTNDDEYNKFDNYQNTNVYSENNKYTIGYIQNQWYCLEETWENIKDAVNIFIIKKEG